MVNFWELYAARWFINWSRNTKFKKSLWKLNNIDNIDNHKILFLASSIFFITSAEVLDNSSAITFYFPNTKFWNYSQRSPSITALQGP